MIVSLPSAALVGVDAYRVDVEVDVGPGLPAYNVVGLAATCIKEGASRIRSALRNCGQDLPTRKITVNLAPADRRKEGAAFDLPIALGVLVAAGARADALTGLLILGELGLDGTVRGVRGVLAASTLARDLGLRGVLVPRASAAEACAVAGIEVYAVGHLAEAVRALDGADALPQGERGASVTAVASACGDFADIRGQDLARRAVEIAVAGGHNLLLLGPPGVGKTMIAQRVPTILPSMTHEEAIEVTKVYSAAGLTPAGGLIERRPFRAPHHTTSVAALVGGGPAPRPGEISLAHRGVLFLDELPEFSRTAIEALRQPLEERAVRIGRARESVRLPAAFHLVASANPCPCGWLGSDERTCICSPGAIERYRSRLSGPLLDRIDLQVRVGQVALSDMRADAGGETSLALRARVEAARARQERRLAPFGVRTNAEMGPAAVRATCRLSTAAERALAQLYARKAGMSARGLDRVVRTARTICDLDGVEGIGAEAILTAASYRALDVDPVVDPRRFLAVAPVPGTSA